MPPRLYEKMGGLVPPRPQRMQEMEAYAQEHQFPIIGPACGQLCYQIAKMIAARKVFELGSGYGYSTAWFARILHTTAGRRRGVLTTAPSKTNL